MANVASVAAKRMQNWAVTERWHLPCLIMYRSSSDFICWTFFIRFGSGKSGRRDIVLFVWDHTLVRHYTADKIFLGQEIVFLLLRYSPVVLVVNDSNLDVKWQMQIWLEILQPKVPIKSFDHPVSSLLGSEETTVLCWN